MKKSIKSNSSSMNASNLRRASRSVCGMDDLNDFSMDMSGSSSFQYDGGDGNGGGGFDLLAK